MIGLINYGSGNIHAIANIYKRLNIGYEILTDPLTFKKVDKLILPGVGAFDETMNLLNLSGMKEELDELVLSKKMPILGVCVGMQILGNGSEEGNKAGFGWIKGLVKKLDYTKLEQKPYLPHLGWNSIKPIHPGHGLYNQVDFEKGYYFLHSYYFECQSDTNILSTTTYGIDFASSINYENVYGVQFHPEKSHENGIQLFKNYANL